MWCYILCVWSTSFHRNQRHTVVLYCVMLSSRLISSHHLTSFGVVYWRLMSHIPCAWCGVVTSSQLITGSVRSECRMVLSPRLLVDESVCAVRCGAVRWCGADMVWHRVLSGVVCSGAVWPHVLSAEPNGIRECLFQLSWPVIAR